MEKNVEAFLKVLDPADNTTGGGTASAVAGAMAASLAAMVARLSLGKKGMEADDYYIAHSEALTALSNELFDGGRLDSQAFSSVRAAFQLPKSTDDEKAARSKAIQAAWIQAADVPLANARRCGKVLALAAELNGRSNENCASDLSCAIYLAEAGIKGCLENVAINLPMIKDQALVTRLFEEAESIREQL